MGCPFYGGGDVGEGGGVSEGGGVEGLAICTHRRGTPSSFWDNWYIVLWWRLCPADSLWRTAGGVTLPVHRTRRFLSRVLFGRPSWICTSYHENCKKKKELKKIIISHKLQKGINLYHVNCKKTKFVSRKLKKDKICITWTKKRKCYFISVYVFTLYFVFK